jgi:hypothetical protein
LGNVSAQTNERFSSAVALDAVMPAVLDKAFSGRV